jgi:hypothetical protein
MNTGEPPGRNDIQAESPDSALPPKPARITVRFDFPEAETGIVTRGHKGMLNRPLRDMLDAATVRTMDQGEGNRPLRKTIGMFQGLTTKRVDGLMRYEASVSAGADAVDEVKENVSRGLASLQETFRGRLESVTVTLETPSATSVRSDDGISVELGNETFDRDDERRKNDGDPVGAEVSRA